MDHSYQLIRNLYAFSKSPLTIWARRSIFLLPVLFLWSTSVNVQAQVVRSFAERASFNQRGDIEMIGNVLVTCSSADTECADIQDGTATGNNNRQMQYVNIDGGAGFDNSSSAELTLPAGATVLSAGLYWGGRADPSDTGRGTIQFQVAGSGSYTPVSADQLDTFTTQGGASTRPYQAFADVTSMIQAAGNGTYFAGDLTASLGEDGLGFYGGWSLIVIYQDDTQPFRRLMLFDGGVIISNADNPSETVTVSGLLTPQSGSFDTFMGALVWEGDQSITGDQFLLNGTNLSDGQNPSGNFWNSSITRLGTRVSAKNPDYVNQLAVDLDYVDASGILSNGATSADLQFTTTGDTYFPHALTFATDLHVPDLTSTFEKTAVDLNGGELMPDDIIEYTISYENTGQDGAIAVILTDPIPNFTSYEPNSLNIITNSAGAPTGSQTDASGDDVADFDSGSNQAVFRLGSGADSNDGGTVAPGESVSVSFQVRVDDDVNVSGQTITNTATISYSSETLPDEEFSGETDAELTVADLADLIINKVVNNSTPEFGSNIIFTISVTNAGPADATGVQVDDTLPSGYTFVSATPSQGSYDDGTGIWSVGSLNVSGSATLEIEATVLETGDYVNIATVTGDQEDPDLTNNEDDAETNPVSGEIEITLLGGPCWRMLSSPVDGLTYAGMLEGLWTQGVPGSEYEPGPPNVFLWDNTVTGNTGGWIPPSSLNNTIPPGTGFLISVYADDDYDGIDDPFPKTLSVSGPAHTGDITPPMNTNPDGWTLVGNPYNAPLDFSALTTSELTDIGYVYDRNYTGPNPGDTNGNTGGWRSTDGTFGDVTDGAFAPGQGFFVQNTGSPTSPSVTFTEAGQTTGGEFYGKEKELRDYVRLEVQGEFLYNSMWIRFSGDGSVEPAYGDALELQPLAEQYALLGARKTDNTLVDIGHFPLPDEALQIPVYVEATQSGSYTITATELDIPAGMELYLHDLDTGETVAITDSFEYTFTISQAAAKSTPDQGITSCSAEPAKAKTTDQNRFMITTSAGTPGSEVPEQIALGQNYPNPFNPATQITYELPQASEVHLEVFDMLGRRVATLVEGTVQAGVHQVNFNASHLTSGVYLYRLEAAGQVFTRKLTLIK